MPSPADRNVLRRGWWAVQGAALLALTVAPAAVLAGGISCIRNGAVMDVHMPGHLEVALKRNRAGTIYINGSGCSGATVTNIDTIRFLGDAANQHVNIWLTHGGYRPGLTNEPGASDEIEIYLFLGQDDPDGIDLEGSDEADHIRLGSTQTASGYRPRMNLNADETTGIDADVFISRPVIGLWVKSGLGADVVAGSGGAGTGKAWTTNFKASGGNGPDTITGGTSGDYLIGGLGADQMFGGQGPDDLVASDGVAGNDSAYGGAGDDICDGDPGDVLQSCDAS